MRLKEEPRPPSFSLSAMLAREPSREGAIPEITPLSTAMANAKRNALVSKRIVFHPATNRATSGGMCARIIWMSHWARNKPSAAPPNDSMMLSISNWRTSLQRLPPSAVRTASSFVRPVMRANWTFATSAQAMSRTNPTATMSSTMYCRVSVPVMNSRSGCGCSRQALLVSG